MRRGVGWMFYLAHSLAITFSEFAFKLGGLLVIFIAFLRERRGVDCYVASIG